MRLHEVCIICGSPVMVRDERYECARCRFTFDDQSTVWRAVNPELTALSVIWITIITRPLLLLGIAWILSRLRGGAFSLAGRRIVLGSDGVFIRGITRAQQIRWGDVLSVQPFDTGVDIVFRPARVFSLRGFFANEQDRNEFVDAFVRAQDRCRPTANTGK